MIKRCDWAEKSEEERKYHDLEWGVPIYDDQKLFELLILEGMQAGLSWITILNKRDNFKQAFNYFDVIIVSHYTPEKAEELMNNTGIVRNKRKINATIQNAKSFIKIQNEFGSFSRYIWSFVNGKPVVNDLNLISDVPSNSILSDLISKDLKKRGFSFVGSTIIYSFLQSAGLINDHLNSCFRKKEIIGGY